jgi:hypothetical protein
MIADCPPRRVNSLLIAERTAAGPSTQTNTGLPDRAMQARLQRSSKTRSAHPELNLEPGDAAEVFLQKTQLICF